MNQREHGAADGNPINEWNTLVCTVHPYILKIYFDEYFSHYVQDAEDEETRAGTGPGEANPNPTPTSWDLSTDKLPGPVAKLCKTESQTLMSPR